MVGEPWGMKTKECQMEGEGGSIRNENRDLERKSVDTSKLKQEDIE